MNDSSTSKSTVTIKKYANRRLYNTATSSYVTLEDLSAMVKEGVEFNVYDAKTSEDITRSVLTQIIVEEEGKSGQQNLLPIGFLRQLISFYGDNMQWMVPKYLEHSMQMLSQNQDQIKNYFQSAFGGMFPFGSTFEEMGKQNLAMFERTMTMFTKMSPTDCSMSAFTTTTPSSNSSTSTPSSTTDNPMWNLANCFMNACASATPAAPLMAATKSTSSNDTSSCSQNKSASSSTSNASQTCSNTANTSTNTTTNQTTPTADNVTLISATTTPAQTATSVPMTNVKNATTNNTNTAADDMQQKIANLQRQLADLAKNRA